MPKEQPIEVRDMAIVHRTFRNIYEESARLVRAAPAPSPGRVTFLADYIYFAFAALHHHHKGRPWTGAVDGAGADGAGAS